MAVMQRLEAVVASYRVLKPLDLFIVKLDQRAALRADQMIVMAVFVIVFVENATVVELEFSRKSALFQELQGPVDGCESYRRVFGFDDRVEVFARDVALGIKKHIEDQLALVGALEPLAFEVLVKDLFLFALHIVLRKELPRLYTP